MIPEAVSSLLLSVPARTRLLPILLFLGIAIPATELFLLFLISNWIGFWPTLGLIVTTGVFGALLWRWQGFGVVGRLRTGLAGGILQNMVGTQPKPGDSPLDVLLDGAMVFFAGGLLLTPGVLTDLVGFALLIPATRSFFKKGLVWYFKRRFKMVDFSAQFQAGQAYSEMPGEFPEDDSDIIEGEIISRSDDSPRISEDREDVR